MSAESVPTDRLIGQILAERYEILHRLGEGAMGVVYKARHVKVGRMFAVKVLHARLLTDPKVQQRFEREAELAGRLRHPNVVGVVDVGEVDDMHYMVMDFAEGPDLAQLLVEAPMPPARIIALVRPMLEGLYHAHEHGLIHRDLKPENVIIERDSHGGEMPRIVDFGIALLREGGDAIDGQGRLTTNGLVLGTPHYMAPEQAVADPIDHRIDLFALGIVIYEMLSGRLPFDGSGAEVARANLLLDPPPIVKRVPYLEVDPLLEAFSRLLMAKKRDARPATAHAARELLDLIDRDRRGAAKALGVPPELSERAPAITQPVTRHPRDPAAGERTVTMRATPGSPSRADQIAPWLSSIPSETIAQVSGPNAGVPTYEVATASSTSMPVWPAPPASPAPHHPPGPPIVFSAPPWGAMAGPGAHPADTAMRTPLAWPPVHAPRRRAGWILGGIALGTAGIVTVWQLMQGPAHDPRREPRVVLSAIAPAPSDPTSIPAPVVPAPVAPAPVAPAPIDSTPVAPAPVVPAPIDSTPVAPAPVAPTPVAPAPAEITTSPPPPVSPVPTKPADPRLSHGIASKRVAMRDPKPPRVPMAPPARPRDSGSRVLKPEHVVTVPRPSDAAPGEPAGARPLEPAPPDARANAPASVDPAPVEPKATRPAPARPCDTTAPSLSGIAPNAISTLYYAVAKQIGLLPPDQARDLWARFSRLNVNELMGAPQATRDAAAVSLWQIDKEAGCRRAR